MSANNDSERWSLIPTLGRQTVPFRSIEARRVGVVFRMGVPFAQISDSSVARRPLSQCNGFVAEWHSLEQVAKPFVPCRRNRCLLNEHVSSMDRTEQQPASFAVRITGLNMLAEGLQRGLREMQQRSVVVGRPRTHELHKGHSRSRSGSQSGVASCWAPWFVTRGYRRR